ncbi:hypothetical protein G5B38_15350 [Pseudohalocynthiibacter aestuariivivens]|nr:hypothetical protein [Pseudohalocynthiibacter aestuariivivens]QIE46789.1 hypothetical protein G5B38_15350 [Pseudohalocynthiibacter aestuariivivens]
MKHTRQIEEDLLALIECDDTGDGLPFYDHHLITTNAYPTTYQSSCLNYEDWNNQRRYSLGIMRDSGLISFSGETFESVHVSLTIIGHAKLEEYRQDKPLRNGLRWLGRQTDKLLSSLVLPIIAAVLTVLALNFLGLNK